MREGVLTLARKDPRVTGGAVTGSIAVGAEDRWSDIDLSFGIADGVDPEAVLAEWTQLLEGERNVLHHWDLRSGPTIYRVFLLSGGLELDIAVTPAAEFAARGPKFQLAFGASVESAPNASPPLDDMIGLGWIHALNARAAIERGKYWQAEYWISSLRYQALALACLRAGEAPDYARGVDRLARDVTAPYEQTLVRSLDESELRHALVIASVEFVREVAQAKP